MRSLPLSNLFSSSFRYFSRELLFAPRPLSPPLERVYIRQRRANSCLVRCLCLYEAQKMLPFFRRPGALSPGFSSESGIGLFHRSLLLRRKAELFSDRGAPVRPVRYPAPAALEVKVSGSGDDGKVKNDRYQKYQFEGLSFHSRSPWLKGTCPSSTPA